MTGEPVAATAEPGQHLIGDQQGARLPHQRLHLLEEGATHHRHPAGTLEQRLQDHRCGRLLQRGLQHGQGRLFPGVHIGVIPPGGGPWTTGNGEQLVVEGFTEQVAFAHGHGTEGVAVISAVEGHDLVPRFATVHPPLTSDLQRHLHSGGTVVGEKQPIKSRELAQPLPQTFRRLMGEVSKNHLFEAGGLIGNGLGHHRVTMAMQRHPPAADGIDQGTALLPQQQGSIPGNHPLRQRRRFDLRERRPEVGMS